jgi:hydroxymethylbilane synthase
MAIAPRIGGKGLFTVSSKPQSRPHDRFAVTAKDCPRRIESRAGAIRREDPRDALIGKPLEALGPGSRVATGSLRRKVQLEARVPGIAIEELRGNVDTRLRKLEERGLDVIVLAMAGLNRLGISRPDVVPLARENMIPAVGQGALAVQCRRADDRVLERLRRSRRSHDRRSTPSARSLATYGGGCERSCGCARAVGRIEPLRLACAGGKARRAASIRGRGERATGTRNRGGASPRFLQGTGGAGRASGCFPSSR